MERVERKSKAQRERDGKRERVAKKEIYRVRQYKKNERE